MAQLSIAIQVSVIKVKVTVTKIEIQFLLNNFCLLWPIDNQLGACNQCNRNNGFIFSSLPSFISYSCHINTWFRRIVAFLVMLVGILPINSISNTDSATTDLRCQKEVIHADVRQQAVVVQEEILQVAGNKALLLFV